MRKSSKSKDDDTRQGSGSFIIKDAKAVRAEAKVRYSGLRAANTPPRELITEQEIQAGIAADADNPEWSDAMFAKAKRGRPKLPAGKGKESISIRLDSEVLKHYRLTGRGWQSQLNADLLALVKKKGA